MAHPNEELLRRATDALNAGDIEAFLGMHTDDIVLHVTGRNALSGEFKGKAEVASSLQQQVGMLDSPPEFELHDVLATDEHGVVLGRQRATRGGKTLEVDSVVVVHVRDGRFSEVWVTSNDPYAEDEFFA
jgi:ketosteroid isomerase-like protein